MNKNLALAKYTLVLVCCIFAGGVFGQEPAYPIPTGDPNQLFYLQRTSNSNTVVYGLNYKNGALDPEEPVNAYWIRYADQGQKSDLTFLQRHFAYGIKATKDGDDQYKLLFTAYKDITMTWKTICQ
ncbi:MAG: DUF4833 domain-containing protein [Chryseobacterium sp.]|nr:MAG: DUF4833 domain-containing protein [Chryseobacterium sp.]